MVKKNILLLKVLLASLVISGCCSLSDKYISIPVKAIRFDTTVNYWDASENKIYTPTEYKQQMLEHKITDSIEQEKRSVIEDFVITEIYEGDGVYEIIVKNDSNSYEIVSLKTDEKKDLNIVKKGKKYRMKLIPYFNFYDSEDTGFPRERTYMLYIDGYKIQGANILHWQLYTTPNLKGLYYLPIKE